MAYDDRNVRDVVDEARDSYGGSVQALRQSLEAEHKAASQEASALRQRLHEVELIRTGCQAALAAMEQEDADSPPIKPQPGDYR